MRKRDFTKWMLAALAAAPLAAQSQTIKLPKISGLANVRYSYSSDDDTPHGFDVRRIRLAASGDFTPYLDYKVQAEYETSVKVIDAYVRLKLHPALNVQIGEFKVPYSQETLYGPATWTTIENPAVVSRLNGYQDLSGLKANGRDVGVMLYGDVLRDKERKFSYVSYKAGVFNGNGINTKDNNNKKDVAALLYLRPLKPLTFTVGHYQGSYGELHEEHVRIRTTGGAEWSDGALTLRSEYIHGNTGGKKSDGVYALAAYKIGGVVEPLLSYDYFRADKDAAESSNNYQVGVNVIPLKNFRIQAAYTYQQHKVAQDTHLAEVQLIASF